MYVPTMFLCEFHSSVCVSEDEFAPVVERAGAYLAVARESLSRELRGVDVTHSWECWCDVLDAWE